MKRIAALYTLILVLGITLFPFVGDAKKGPKAKVAKVPVFNMSTVLELSADITEINTADSSVSIKEGKGAKKKVLLSGATIIRVTEDGSRIATISELAKNQKTYFWVKKALGPNKSYQGLVVTQFVSNKVAASQGPTVQFTSIASLGGENSTAPVISITLSAAVGQEVKINYTLAGTATANGTDYTAVAQELTIPAGQTFVTVPLTIVDDSSQEPDETVIFNLTGATNATLGVNKTYTYTITDNDQPRVNFSSATATGPENTASVQIPIALTAPTSQEVRVDYSISGTATATTDFTLINGTAVIPVGQTTATITATIVDDTTLETSETIIVTLSNPRGTILGSTSTYTYTITDNDQPTIGFAAANSINSESTTTITIPVTIPIAATREARVNYTVSGGTATAGAVDYTLANGTLIIPVGQTTANISITVANDTTDELDETILITLSSPVDATLGTTITHTYTIQDNDNPTVQFLSATGSGGENISPVNISVSLSNAPVVDIQIPYTVGGTATAGGVDYTLANGTLTIPAGQTSGSISLAIVDDAIPDANETVTVTLSAGANSSLGGLSSYTYTVTDND